MPVTLELYSERLLLRPLVDADVDLGHVLLTDPQVMRYVGKTLTAEEVPQEMANVVKRCAGGRIGVWCVIDRESGEKLGTAVLLPLPIDLEDTDWSLVTGDELPDAEIEVGYILKPSAWGKGYATEIARRMLRFAFEDVRLDEVVAVTDPDNAASQHVLKKAGMTEEGLRRAYSGFVASFRMTRDAWHARSTN